MLVARLRSFRLWPSRRTSDKASDEHHRHFSLEHRILRRIQSWTIDLEKQDLTDQDMPTVAKYTLIKNHCKRIRLRANQITGEGCAILAKALDRISKLESLDLSHNHIGDLGVQYLSTAVASSAIRTLNLEVNGITAQSAIYLAQMLEQSPTLTELYLSKNHLGDQGVELLAKALAEDDASSIYKESAGAVSQMIHNRGHLESLILVIFFGLLVHPCQSNVAATFVSGRKWYYGSRRFSPV